jgi:2-C-methyl-D-erythritol 4-phosphate cytidylyltransferase / 2-C-methyl-D-erythritol 2,4-cyclodiphosphate synthase
MGAPAPVIRTGTGYDVHRLARARSCGCAACDRARPRPRRAFSDADVALHALVDAILGALAKATSAAFPAQRSAMARGASDRFLEHAVALAARGRLRVGNVDVTIICEAPKIGPHREAMRANLARLLGTWDCGGQRQGHHHRKLGFTGRGEGIAAQAVATLAKP